MRTMNTYQRSGFEYFFDTNIRFWTLYPINPDGTRKEWGSNGEPIECEYFHNKKQMEKFFEKIETLSKSPRKNK